MEVAGPLVPGPREGLCPLSIYHEYMIRLLEVPTGLVVTTKAGTKGHRAKRKEGAAPGRSGQRHRGGDWDFSL